MAQSLLEIPEILSPPPTLSDERGREGSFRLNFVGSLCEIAQFFMFRIALSSFTK